MGKKSCCILGLAVVVLTCAFCACASQQAAPTSTADRKEMLIEEAMMRIQAEYNMEGASLNINNSGDTPFAGCILSALKLQSQIVVVALYSMPVDVDSDFFKFRLSEFIVDDLDLEVYRESTHEVFSINRYNGSIETTKETGGRGDG